MSRSRTFAAATLLGALPLFAAACGGGGGSDSAAAFTVAITDSASDDVTSFIVDVNGITLTRKDGTTLSVLSHPVNVDLATLDGLSRIIDFGLVSPAVYTKATINLDFTHASCFLVGHANAATIQDDDGNALTGVVSVPLDLTASPIASVGGRNRVLEFDFDFDQSVTTDTLANTVFVAPSIVVRVDRSDPRELVALGDLQSVDLGNLRAELDLQTLAGVSLAPVTLQFSNTTIFQVDGVPLAGSAGLSLLGTKPVGTWAQCFGAADPAAAKINVTYLEAGTGTWNGGQDIVDGYVIGRTGAAGADPTFTVLGTSSNATHTAFHFNTAFSVDADFSNTKVVVRGSASHFDTDVVNVGQLVRVFGSLSGTILDATATSAVLRLEPTPLSGLALAAPSGGHLTLDLKRVGNLDFSDFTWSQGGTSPPDPANFVLDVGTLGNSLGIGAGTPVFSRAFFTPVDDNGVDAAALTLEDRTDAPAVMTVRDRAAGFTVVTDTSGSQVQFTITGSAGATEKATIDQGFVGAQNLPAVPTPTVVVGTKEVSYVLHHVTSGAIDVFSKFADWHAAFAAALTGGEVLKDFVAVGPYDAVTNTSAATLITAFVE